MNDDDRRNLRHQLVDLEAEHRERTLRAMEVHARNLDHWCTEMESGRAVFPFVADDDPSPSEAAELVAVAEVYPFMPPRQWGDTPMIVMCIIDQSVSESTARRAPELRRRARPGSAVDALVVAIAEPAGTVVTGNRADTEALAAHANGVAVEVV